MPCLVQKTLKNENHMSIVIGLFVGVCSILSTTVVAADWFQENDAPIIVAPLNFSANLFNANVEEVLPYTRMGADDALEFWPEVEEGEVEELIFVVAVDEENDARWERALAAWPGEDPVSTMWSEEMEEAYERNLAAEHAAWLSNRIRLS